MGSVRLSARSSTNVNERNDGNSTSPAAFIASRSRQSAPLLPYEPSPNAKCDIDLLTCKLCGDLIQLLPTEPLVPDNSTGTDRRGYMTEQPHHSKKDALLTSASTCSICRLISEGLDYLDYHYYTVGTYLKHPAFLWVKSDLTSLFVASINLLRGAETALQDHSYGLGKMLLKNPYRHREFLVPVPDTYPTTNENIEVIKSWVDRCRNAEEHWASAPLLKRVLDVSDAGNGVIKLHLSGGEMAAYAAVSYCWGTGTTLKMTRENIDKHVRGIALEEFPETLRDVVVFAQGLGFQYVWIDAFCIIQGDDLDWAEQASNMTNIYHNCALNIAVGDVPNSSAGTGCKLKDFNLRVGRVVSDTLLESEDDASQCGIPADLDTIYAVSAPIPRSVFSQDSDRLATRGWVFQETLAPVASVFITHSGLLWDCCTERCYQGGKPSPRRDAGHPVEYLTTKRSWARDTCGVSSLSPSTGPSRWKRISTLRLSTHGSTRSIPAPLGRFMAGASAQGEQPGPPQSRGKETRRAYASRSHPLPFVSKPTKREIGILGRHA